MTGHVPLNDETLKTPSASYSDGGMSGFVHDRHKSAAAAFECGNRDGQRQNHRTNQHDRDVLTIGG